MTITFAQLSEWLALADKATPPPLEISRYGHGGARVFGEGKRELVADYYHERDREFYIIARTAVPALIAEVVELQQRLRRAEALCYVLLERTASDTLVGNIRMAAEEIVKRIEQVEQKVPAQGLTP